MLEKAEEPGANEMAQIGEHEAPYQAVFGDVSRIIDAARESAARSVNAAMTAAYWLDQHHCYDGWNAGVCGSCHRIVEFEQSGEERAEYGAALIERLAADLTQRLGRGFSRQNIQHMRLFYISYPLDKISQTVSGKLGRPPQLPNRQTASGKSGAAPVDVRFDDLLAVFPLPWSAYVRLLSVKNAHAREFYEAEALRGGWSVRQLVRQINSQFYERTALSKNKAAMLRGGQRERPEDIVRAEEAIKDPFVLEFLDLKDEYSESDLEEALIQHLEIFLLELGDDFCFVGRQRRLRVGSQWYRVDLLFFHRRLKCLVVIDLKIGAFTHADAGQMHFYLNYAREHWVREGENPPVGLILCSEKDEALARYALEGLSNNVMAAEYRITLPDEELLAAELDRTRQAIELRTSITFPAATMRATLSVRKSGGTIGATQGAETAYSDGLISGYPLPLGNAQIPGDENLIWNQHYRFQCVNCKLEADLRRTEDGSLEQLVCRNPECLYDDTPYDQNAILHVMLDALLLAPYHQEIRRKLDERRAPRLRQPYFFELISGPSED